MSRPEVSREQAAIVMTEMSIARNAIYRAAQALALDDEARTVLWEMAGHVEDAKVLLLRRCRPCRGGDEG